MSAGAAEDLTPCPLSLERTRGGRKESTNHRNSGFPFVLSKEKGLGDEVFADAGS
jgi:hypothetical protein